MGEVLKVFISATSADLGTLRVAAKDALLTLDYFPIEQAHFGPQASTLQEMDRRKLEESDAVLHIVGERYGAEPPAEGGQRRSFTQWEYHIARELMKPLYLFICADSFPYDPHEPEPEEFRASRARTARRSLAGSTSASCSSPARTTCASRARSTFGSLARTPRTVPCSASSSLP